MKTLTDLKDAKTEVTPEEIMMGTLARQPTIQANTETRKLETVVYTVTVPSPRLEAAVNITSPRLEAAVHSTSPRLEAAVNSTSPRPDSRVSRLHRHKCQTLGI